MTGYMQILCEKICIALWWKMAINDYLKILSLAMMFGLVLEQSFLRA